MLEQSFTEAILQTAISGHLPTDYKTKPPSLLFLPRPRTRFSTPTAANQQRAARRRAEDEGRMEKEEANFLSPCKLSFCRPRTRVLWKEGNENLEGSCFYVSHFTKKENHTPSCEKPTLLIFYNSFPSLIRLVSFL